MPDAAAAEPSRTLATTHALSAGIAIVCAMGALGLLLRDLLAGVGLMRWVRRAQPLSSPRWRATLRGLTRDVGPGTTLRIFESARVTSPCTWGLARPVLLLPLRGADWPESRRRAALLHELAHIRRFDYASALVARLACAMHWYNPLAWWAAAQARRLQEQACDDAVLLAGGRPSEYAQFLLEVAGASGNELGSLRAAIGMMRRSALHRRVLAILDPQRVRMQPSRRAILATLLPLCILSMVLAAAATVPEVNTNPVAPARASARQIIHHRAEVQIAALATPAMLDKRAAAAPSATQATAEKAAPADEPPTPAIPAIPAIPATPPVPPEAPALVQPVKPIPPLEPVPPVQPVKPIPPLEPPSHADHELRPFRAQLMVQAQ